MMNIYEKINEVKLQILTANLKKSGKNKFAGYDYFELSDFLPFIVWACNKVWLFTTVSFNETTATLKVVNCETPSEVVEITSPMKELELKGCNQIQALGWVETYQRRYLYMSLFDIVENDMFDSTVSEEKKQTVKERLEETNQKMFQMSLKTFKENIDKVDRKDKEALKSLLEEWRRLVQWKWWISEEDRKFIVDVCLWIKNEIE